MFLSSCVPAFCAPVRCPADEPAFRLWVPLREDSVALALGFMLQKGPLFDEALARSYGISGLSWRLGSPVQGQARTLSSLLVATISCHARQNVAGLYGSFHTEEGSMSRMKEFRASLDKKLDALEHQALAIEAHLIQTKDQAMQQIGRAHV